MAVVAPEPTPPSPDAAARTSLMTLWLLFLRLGLTSFGGPAVHIANLRREVVQKRPWLTEARFLDLMGATNLIPGPNSTEMVMHTGWVRRGMPGLVVAGTAFIVPPALITGACGYAYVTWGTLPQAGWLLYGIKPVMLGVVAQAVWALGRKALPDLSMRSIALAAAVAALLGVGEIPVMFACGALASVLGDRARGTRGGWAPVLWAAGPTAAATTAALATPTAIFTLFLKTGLALFGSGYLLLAFLRTDFVERTGWLTESQLVDAIAVGQITPGPVFTTATFIGWLLSGPWGAVAATVGIFLPAFFFVAISGPLIPRIRGSAAAGRFLDGLNAASVALMAVVLVQLARAALVDPATVVMAAAAALALIAYDVGSTWLVLAGGAAGWAVHAAGLAGGR